MRFEFFSVASIVLLSFCGVIGELKEKACMKRRIKGEDFRGK
jgi:hypothetical protein